jgi:hypothetical protein
MEELSVTDMDRMYDEQEGSEPEEVPPRQRYKSTKGDADKRKITSKQTVVKAQQAKIAKSKQRKLEEANQYEIPSDEDEYESEEEIIEQPKRKTKPKHASTRAEMEAQIRAEILAEGKKKKKKTKRVIQLPVPKEIKPVKKEPTAEEIRMARILQMNGFY